MSDVLNGNDQDDGKNESELVPDYVASLFRNITRQTKVVSIAIGWINGHVLAHKAVNGIQFYGTKLFKHIHVNESNQIKFNVIRELYPSMTTLYIQHVEKVDGRYKY